MNNLQETHRLAFMAIEVLSTLERCVSELHTGFLDDNDIAETAKTIKQLHARVLELDRDVMNRLNEGKGD